MDLATIKVSTITMSNPEGPIPDGLKMAGLTGPSVLDPASSYPVLAIGSFLLWPMSYTDNRCSFGMVLYDPSGNIKGQKEIPGARYIYKITLDGSNATFWGQSDQNVTMTFDQIWQMMVA
jgi:hypothetical protein